MEWCFYLISKGKNIERRDYNTALSNLSAFNKNKGPEGANCVASYHANFITVKCGINKKAKSAEGFVLNLLINLFELEYKPKVLSRELNYGTEKDWVWLQTVQEMLESKQLVPMRAAQRDATPLYAGGKR